MAIAHNSTTSTSNSFASSLTFANAPAGTDRFIANGTVVRSSTITITSVTHNGKSLSSIDDQTTAAMRVALHGLANPDTTGNVVVNLSGSANVLAIANSYSGVHQTTPLGTPQNDVQSLTAGNTTSITLTSASGELCIDIFGNRNADTPTITGGQTARGTVNSVNQINGAMSEEAGAASVVMSWSIATSNQERIQIGVPLKPATAAANALTSKLGLLGVGI